MTPSELVKMLLLSVLYLFWRVFLLGSFFLDYAAEVVMDWIIRLQEVKSE